MTFIHAAHALNDMAAGLKSTPHPLRTAAETLRELAVTGESRLLEAAMAVENFVMLTSVELDREQRKSAATLAALLHSFERPQARLIPNRMPG
ncbi:MAG: hypothetical protein ACRYGK_06485 [Janthinobacterium lividum]